jgi:putative transposase
MRFGMDAEAWLSTAWRPSNNSNFIPCNRHNRLILDTLHHWWRRKSKGKPRKPRISPEAIALIHQMALENRTWGAKRIRDELRKLNHRVSKRTVRKYMKQARRDLPPRQSGQTWATFLKNHASEIWAPA